MVTDRGKNSSVKNLHGTFIKGGISMAKLNDLETRIRVLEDIEAIRKLKSKYWRCVDRKLWDEIVECLTEDMVLSVFSTTIEGRNAFVQFLKDALSQAVSAHQGHQAEIEITSESTARATWVLNDLLLDMQPGVNYTGFGYYEDEYIKEDGNWKIKRSKVTYYFTQIVSTRKSSKW
jgi:bile-acid 7alpha-dehydratase